MRAVLDDGDVISTWVYLGTSRFVTFRHVSWHATSYVTRNVKFASGETSRMMSQRSFVLRYDMYKARGKAQQEVGDPTLHFFAVDFFPKKFNCIQRYVSMKWKSKF